MLNINKVASLKLDRRAPILVNEQQVNTELWHHPVVAEWSCSSVLNAALDSWGSDRPASLMGSKRVFCNWFSQLHTNILFSNEWCVRLRWTTLRSNLSAHRLVPAALYLICSQNWWGSSSEFLAAKLLVVLWCLTSWPVTTWGKPCLPPQNLGCRKVTARVTSVLVSV